MNDRNDSLIEIAYREMSKKRKPKTLEKICKDVFEIKGVEYNDESKSQFQIDFMLSGYFICCGEDKNGEKLWDLKSRQSSSLLDKDGSYLDDPYDDDDDVKKNELNDDLEYKLDEEIDEEEIDDDENDEEEADDIEEELMYSSFYDEDDESFDDEKDDTYEEDDDVEEDSYDDDDK